jgi:predicted nucleic-acid-binding Zn-ribbon protein
MEQSRLPKELTEEQRLKIATWLSTKDKSQKCPVCNEIAWVTESRFGCAPVYAVGTGMDFSYVHPFVVVVCTNCGYTRLFNAVIMGLLGSPPDQPEAGAAQ